MNELISIEDLLALIKEYGDERALDMKFGTMAYITEEIHEKIVKQLEILYNEVGR